MRTISNMFAVSFGSFLGLSLLGVSSLIAEERARTAQLPPALLALQTPAVEVLTISEAKQVRGQALDPQTIIDAAQQVHDRGQVLELGGGISFFSNVFFGEGVLINLNTGTGALFDPAAPGQWLITFAGLRGNFVVDREGTTLRFTGIAP